MISNLPSLLPLDSNLFDLPMEVVTRSGVKFNPRLNKWTYRESTLNVSLDFSNLNATDQLVNSSKKVLIWYAENRSPDHLKNMFSYFSRFLQYVTMTRGLAVGEINAKDILNYRSYLTKKDSYFLGNISGFLQKWHSFGIAGVSDDAIVLLKQLRLKGNLKGEAVSTMDILDGPFTDNEVEALHAAIDYGYKTGELKIGDYLLVWLFLALGQRPTQYASLKVRDFERSIAKDGTAIYILNIPRAKQREQLSRSSFSRRALIPQIGETFVKYVEEVTSEFTSILSDSSLAPLFPAKRSNKNEPIGFEYHRTSGLLAIELKKVLKKLNVISERTGKQLNITATRFRRTLGTRAAMEGHGELVIAELLDHTDTQNVGVYVQATPEIVERIDRAVALHLAPLAQAFAGVIIRNASDARRKGDPASRICDPRFEPSMKPMGNCGQHGFCGELAPIACYTCRSFQPWLDGPHEAVLNHLISERERLMVVSDSRIASINDRTILAVAEVVSRCDEIKSGMSEVANG
ncbi:MAG: tyrosine-type recombinase/integrase [Methylotenera sp.]|nr:tyrosine-type recombinase/integrase [Methylotenera sp.]